MSRDYDAERRLPAGKTCRDCAHGPRCDALFGAMRRAFTICDFHPSRYQPRAPVVSVPPPLCIGAAGAI